MSVLRPTVDAWVEETSGYRNRPDTPKLWVSAAASDARRAFMFFGRPFPLGATIFDARLRLVLAGAWTGQTLVVRRVTEKWAERRINWTNQPATSATNEVSVALTGVEGDVVEVDITALMGDVAAGDAWYGLRLATTATSDRAVYSSDRSTAAQRPQVEIEWGELPEVPVNLVPGGGQAFSLEQPVLSWEFTEPGSRAAQEQSASQVQISTTEDFTTPAYDSGKVANATSQWDMSQTSYLIPADGVRYWRVKVWDDTDQPSGWSDAEQIVRKSKGVLTITSPGRLELRRNHAANPSFETDVTGYQASATTGETITREAGAGAGGSYGLRVVTDGSVGSEGVTGTPTSDRWPAAAKAGETWTVSVNVRGNVGGEQVRIQLLGRDAAGVLQESQAGATVTLTTASQRIGVTRTLSDPDTSRVMLAVVTDVAQAVNFVIDAVLVERAGSIGTYFDGNSTDAAWLGTPHASASALYDPALIATEDTTPTIAWDLAGRTQESWSLWLHELLESGPRQLLHVPRAVSIDEAYDLASGYVRSSRTLRARVRAWDTIDRAASIGDPPYVDAEQEFTYVRSGTPDPVTTLTATPDGARVVLAFSRAARPDYFSLRIDGQEVDSRIDPEEVSTGGSNYSIDWWGATPDTQHTYEIEAVVLDLGTFKHSDGNATALATMRPGAAWLVDPEDSLAVEILSQGSEEVADLAIREVGTTFDVIGARAPVRITDAVMGYAGSVSGYVTTREDLASLLELKGRLKPLRLIVLDLNLPVYLEELSAPPWLVGGVYRVSFGLFQTGEFTFDVAGDTDASAAASDPIDSEGVLL